jgi:hypothetical protein
MAMYLHFVGYALIAVAVLYAVCRGTMQANRSSGLLPVPWIVDWLKYLMGIIKCFMVSRVCWVLGTFGFLALWDSMYFAKS